MPKKSEATDATPVATEPTIESLLTELTPDDVMNFGKKLADLTQAASIALSNFHFTNSRVDRGSVPANPVVMARVQAMSSACHEFSRAIRNALIIGVHDDETKQKILIGLL